MGNNLEFIVRMRDEASKNAKNISASVGDMGKATQGATVSAQALNAQMAALNKLPKGPQSDFLKQFAQLDALQKNLPASVNRTVDALTNQYVKLQMTARQQAQFNAVVQAGVPLGSAAAKGIAEMAGAVYDLRKQQEELAPASDRSSSAGQRLAATLTRRLIFAAAIREVKQLAVELYKLTEGLAAVGDQSKRTGLNTGAFQTLQNVAKAGGIAPDEFAKSAQGMAAALNEGLRVSNSLRQVFALNGLSLKDSAGKAKDLNVLLMDAANLVRNARTEQDKFLIVQELGLPPTEKWVKLLEKGGPALLTAIANMKAAGTEIDERLIRKAQRFDEAWTSSWAKFTIGLRGAIVTAADALGEFASNPKVQKVAEILTKAVTPTPVRIAKDIYDKLGSSYQGAGAVPGVSSPASRVRQGFGDLETLAPNQKLQDALDKAYPSQEAQRTKSLELTKKQNSEDQARLGILGELATVNEKTRQKELEIQGQALNGITISEKRRQQLIDLARAQAEAAQVAVRTANGVATAEELRKVKENELKLAVLNGTMTQKEATVALQAHQKQIEQTTKQMEVYKAALPGLKQFELDAKDLRLQLDQVSTTSLNAITTNLTDITMGTVSAADGFRNLGLTVIRSLQEMLIKMLIVAPIAKALQSTLSGFVGGGLPSPGDANFIGPIQSAKGNVFNSSGLSRYSNQIVNRPTMFAFAKGAGVMGEAGPEAIMPLQRDSSGKLGVRGGGGGGINYAPTFILNTDGSARQEQGNNGDSDKERLMRELNNEVESLVTRKLLRERRAGGLLS